MLSNLFIGLVFGIASILTTSASPIDHANRDNSIACMDGGAPLAAGFDDCEGAYDWLENNKDQSVGIGKKGHRWWLSDTVQVVSAPPFWASPGRTSSIDRLQRLDETWHSLMRGPGYVQPSGLGHEVSHEEMPAW